PRFLAGLVLLSSAAWLAVAVGLRTPYLDLFRGALARGTLAMADDGSEIDVNAAEALVEAMANPEPTHVVAALDLLEQRHRTKLIPALILYHDSQIVLLRSLEIFGRSTRDDSIPLGERLLAHPADAIRVAAVRAHATRGGASALARAADDESSAVQGYAAYHLALGATDGDLATSPRLAAMIGATGEPGDQGRRVLLTAIADAPDPRAIALVLAIVSCKVFKDAEPDVMLAARAMEVLPDPRYVPYCIARLARRPGRDAIRQALAAMGEPALTALRAALDDPTTNRRVRVHVPWTIAKHGTQSACDYLMTRLAQEKDGFVRYKVLRALGHIVATSDVKVDKNVIEGHAHRTLVDHLRLKAVLLAVSTRPGGGVEGQRTLRLLVGLLQNKEDQALERAFRLLKIAHKREDIHRVHTAAISKDKRARSNAGEFLDTLLSQRNQRELRTLFRLVVDDLAPAERVSRAASFLQSIPRDRDAALDVLIADRDEAVASLASYYALALGADDLRAAVDRAKQDRPSLASLMDRFSLPAPVGVTG
ncbi:MAG: translocase, partial [Labilithrix sp.]|nr:translocase [Labilithrix sp.]